MRLFVLSLLTLFLLPAPNQEQACTYSDQCQTGECRAWENGRWVCTRQQYTIAIWDRTCLDRVELAEKSYIEAPLGEDGKPVMARAKLMGAVVTLVKGCQFRYEVRSR